MSDDVNDKVAVTGQEVCDATQELLAALATVRNKFTSSHDMGTSKSQVVVAMAKTITAILMLRKSGGDLQQIGEFHGVDLLKFAEELADKMQGTIAAVDRATFESLGSGTPKAQA